jgi:hypothetical protein
MARGPCSSPRLASWREPSIPLRNYLEGFVTLSRNWIPLSFAPLETIDFPPLGARTIAAQCPLDNEQNPAY